jgi:hypothetical protein
VNFRLNTETGEVETFRVDDIGGARRQTDHDAEHEAIAHRVGSLLERQVAVEEILPDRVPDSVPEPLTEAEPPRSTQRLESTE